MKRLLLAAILAVLGFAAPVRAEAPTEELKLAPRQAVCNDERGLCIVNRTDLDNSNAALAAAAGVIDGLQAELERTKRALKEKCTAKLEVLPRGGRT